MDIFKKYVVIVSIVIVGVFALFLTIDLDEIKTPLNERMQLVENCIDYDDLTNRECMDMYPVDNVMTRPIINITDLFK